MDTQTQSLPAPSPQPKHMISFLVSFCSCLVVMILGLLLIDNFINVIPALFVFFLFVMYAFSKIHKTKLVEPSKYLYPLFLALSVSFAIISFTFGFHSDVFITYDNDDATNPQINRQKWFRASEVLNFPLSQLNYKNKPSAKVIDFGNLKDTSATCNIIIVDKTTSVINSNPKVNDYMMGYIKRTCQLGYKNDTTYNTSELIPPFLVSGLYKNNKHSDANDYVNILYYTGHRGDELAPITESDRIPSVKEMIKEGSQFINKYFEGALNYEKSAGNRARGQRTSFNDIVNALSEHLLNDEIKNKNINVTIISDFINTDPNDTIPDFAKITKLKGLNLYVLDGKDRGNINNQSAQLIEKMVQKFSYLHRNTIVKFKDVNFNNTAESIQFYDELLISNLQVDDQRSESSIPFYFPYKDFNSNQEAVAKVMFKEKNVDIDDTNQYKYCIKISDLDNQNSKFPVFFNINSEKNKISASSEEIFKVRVKPEDTLSLSLPFTSNYISHRLFMDISSYSASKKNVQSVSFRHLLSETTSYYLIVFYTLFVVSICLIIILPNLFVFLLIYSRKIICKSHWHSFFISFPIAIGIVSLSYYIILMFISSLWLTFCFVFFPLLLITIPSFVATYREEAEKDRAREFHIFGTFKVDSFYLFGKQRS